MQALLLPYRFTFIILGIFLLIYPRPETADAEILTENGTLRGFLLGDCPGCAYDNLLSHMSEGIARADYNIYNPLDPQTDGFGFFELMPDGPSGDSLLAVWKQCFSLMMEANHEQADTLLGSQLSDYPFEIVHLTDDVSLREYYIIREQLDSSFVDSNNVEIPEDDEVGSFAYGWGVYIFAVNAVHPRVTVQVVHPNDDYIAPHVAFDIFETLDAGRLFFTTAGREVRWTESGTYNNARSLSDPSRNERHVFQMAHEAAVDYYADLVPDENPFMIQVHSYDTRNRNFSSAIVTPGFHDRTFNLPLYDWSGVLGGMIDRTGWTVLPAGVIGNPLPISALDFYGSSSQPPLTVVDVFGQPQSIPDPRDLYGFSGSKQLNYRSTLIDRCTDAEWLFHLECDELPNSIEDSTEAEFYAAPGFPLTWQNFENIVAYYHPMAEHLRASLDTMQTYEDTEPPSTPSDVRVVSVTENRVSLAWTRAGDPFFDTYRIYHDTVPGITTASPYVDRTSASNLCAQTTAAYSFTDLLFDQDYFFRISGVDQSENESELSVEINVRTENTPRVLDPNGGELWDYSFLNLLRWAGDGFSEGVRIEVNRDYPNGNWELLIASTEDDGEETIIIGGPISASCRIRVSNISSAVTAMSDTNFSIISWQGYLAVMTATVSPIEIHEWDYGEWECPLTNTARFTLRNRGNQSITLLSPTLESGGSFTLEHNCDPVIVLEPDSAAPCTVTVTYAPLNVGEHLDTLLISTDAPNVESDILCLPLRGEQIRTPDSLHIVVGRQESSIRISWDPINESILGCPLQMDYQVWFTHDPETLEYYLGTTVDTTWLHTNAILEDTMLFYRVIAQPIP